MNCSPLWSIQKKTKKPLPLEVENFSAFVKGSLLNQVADIHDDVDTTTVDTKKGPKASNSKFLQEAAPRFSKALQFFTSHMEASSTPSHFISLGQLKRKQKCASAINV